MKLLEKIWGLENIISSHTTGALKSCDLTYLSSSPGTNRCCSLGEEDLFQLETGLELDSLVRYNFFPPPVGVREGLKSLTNMKQSVD